MRDRIWIAQPQQRVRIDPRSGLRPEYAFLGSLPTQELITGRDWVQASGVTSGVGPWGRGLNFSAASANGLSRSNGPTTAKTQVTFVVVYERMLANAFAEICGTSSNGTGFGLNFDTSGVSVALTKFGAVTLANVAPNSAAACVICSHDQATGEYWIMSRDMPGGQIQIATQNNTQASSASNGTVTINRNGGANTFGGKVFMAVCAFQFFPIAWGQKYLLNPWELWTPRRSLGPVSTSGSTPLVVNDSSHVHTAEAVTLSVGLSLTVADAGHAHTADAVVLASTSVLAVADTSHAHTAEAVTLSVGLSLTVADAGHIHTADAVVLTVTSTLVVADAAHAHTAEGVTLSVGLSLAVADSAHVHTADALVLASTSVLAVADAAHVHTAELVTLTFDDTLSVADAGHAHTADALVLTTVAVLTVVDASHGHTAENVVLSVGASLTVADAAHAHTSENVVLSFGTITLVVSDASHQHKADNIRLGVKPSKIEEIIPYILNSLFDGRVWESATPDDLPRTTGGAIRPFVVWSLMGGQDAEYVEQSPAPSHSHARVQLHVAAPNALELAALMKAARDAMLASDYTVGVYGSPVGTYDAARKLKGRFQQFSVWFQQ